MKRVLVVGCVLVLSGCAGSIKEIDVSGYAPSCVRECSIAYSQCAAGGQVVGSKAETLNACRDAYAICASTCPPK